ncbi:MAG: ParA family protein [Bacteroidetes bacterium]|nr:ParA family protein [Bacteroidota bacterium]
MQQQLNTYKFIIIDTPPYLKGSTSLALAASNSVIIPIKSGNYSLIALKKMINYILWIRNNYNPGLKIEGILHTMYESNTKVSTITEKRLYSKFGKYVFNCTIPKNSTIAESTYFGKPVVLYDAKSKGAESYLRLSQELIMRNKLCPILLIYPSL